jgi:hypothetical protein
VIHGIEPRTVTESFQKEIYLHFPKQVSRNILNFKLFLHIFLFRILWNRMCDTSGLFNVTYFVAVIDITHKSWENLAKGVKEYKLHGSLFVALYVL